MCAELYRTFLAVEVNRSCLVTAIVSANETNTEVIVPLVSDFQKTPLCYIVLVSEFRVFLISRCILSLCVVLRNPSTADQVQPTDAGIVYVTLLFRTAVNIAGVNSDAPNRIKRDESLPESGAARHRMFSLASVWKKPDERTTLNSINWDLKTQGAISNESQSFWELASKTSRKKAMNHLQNVMKQQSIESRPMMIEKIALLRNPRKLSLLCSFVARSWPNLLVRVLESSFGSQRLFSW